MDEHNKVNDIDRSGGQFTPNWGGQLNYNQQVQMVQQQSGYGQPFQAEHGYNQVSQPMQQPQQYGQYNQAYQQYGQYSQGQQMQQQYGQYNQGQQMQQPYNNSMGYAGYEYRQGNAANVKKGSIHIPNLINIIGIIMVLISVFLPYAHVGSDVRSISSVFGLSVVTVIIAVIVIIADIICAFIDNLAGYIVDLAISVLTGGALIFEFILTMIDWKKVAPSDDIGLRFGAWFSIVAALVVIASVPVWWAVSRKKKNSDTGEKSETDQI